MAAALINAKTGFDAYQQVSGLGASSSGSSEGFSNILQKTLAQSADDLRSHESLSVKSTMEDVDLTQLITGAAEIDVSVSTVMALRDKIVNLINELMKMQA